MIMLNQVNQKWRYPKRTKTTVKQILALEIFASPFDVLEQKEDDHQVPVYTKYVKDVAFRL